MKNNEVKTVIVTGGTKGLGAFVANKFLEMKWNVLIGARNKSGLASRKHDRLKYQEIDVVNESDHNALVELAIEWTGSFDCYVNSAGMSYWLPLSKIDDDFLEEIISVNLKGTIWGCKAASNYLKNGGTIINISSLAGKRGSANNSLYCAAKFGVNGLTQALAKELGESGIRINAICPVYVKTPGLIEALQNSDAPSSGKSINQYLKNFAKNPSSG